MVWNLSFLFQESEFICLKIPCTVEQVTSSKTGGTSTLFSLFFPRRLSRSWRAVNYIDYIIHVSKFLLKKTSRKFISCKHDNRETCHVIQLKYVLRNISHGGLGQKVRIPKSIISCSSLLRL